MAYSNLISLQYLQLAAVVEEKRKKERKMVKLTNVLILASGLAATAFSLERPIQRIAGSGKVGASFTKSTSFQHSAPSYLKSTEDNR